MCISQMKVSPFLAHVNFFSSSNQEACFGVMANMCNSEMPLSCPGKGFFQCLRTSAVSGEFHFSTTDQTAG